MTAPYKKLKYNNVNQDLPDMNSQMEVLVLETITQ